MRSETVVPAYCLQCHVWLVDSEPPIWRRFHISDQASLATLHRVLQIVMGWQDRHAYDFRIGGDRYQLASSDFPDHPQSSMSQTLAACQLKADTQFLYTYDFGNGWLHRITIEEHWPLTAEPSIPTCVEGERACPPENCGGVWGYEGLLERLNDPEDPEYEDLLEAIGVDFDPDEFDLKAVNQQLQALG